MKFNIYLGIILIFFTYCSSKKTKDTRPEDIERSEAISGLKNGLFFHVIDDIVKVYVNDKLVYESDRLNGREGLDLVVDLQEYITSPSDVVKLKLLNQDCPGCDYNWQILIYELYKNGEPEDYIHESKSAMDTFGEVWEIEYVWGDI